jgi:hypothetical protein
MDGVTGLESLDRVVVVVVAFVGDSVGAKSRLRSSSAIGIVSQATCLRHDIQRELAHRRKQNISNGEKRSAGEQIY